VKACCDVVNRGVAVYGGQVFVGVIDGRLEALDAKTGERNWSVVTVDQSKPYTITGAPRVVDGKVLIGNGGAELGVRGYLSAYAVTSGDLVWRFYTTPNPSKAPDNAASDSVFAELANDSWGDDGEWVTDGGGGTVWDAIVYDAVNDTVVFGVGNGSPWNRNFRDPSGGDNLFLSSIVAVDAKTGTYRWHYQTTPGDNWDYTATQSIILASLPIGPDGAERRVVMQAPKNGFFYVLDAATGEFLSGTPFVPIDWATGLDANGRPIEAEGARYEKEIVMLRPGPLGAHNWHPMAFNPELNLAYIPAQEIPFPFAEDTRQTTHPVPWNTGADFAAGVPNVASRADLVALRATLKGRLIAWDAVAQRPRWSVEHENAWNGGVLSTAGGLVFQGKMGGDFVAYDAATGEDLWSYDLRSGAASGPMTYVVDGVQYITITSGWGSNYALVAGYAYDDLTPSVGKVVTFKLGGTGSIPAPEMAAVARAPKAEPFGSDEQLAAGMVAYQRACAVCHGPLAIGAGMLPDLRWSPITASAEAWRSVVLEGSLAANGMVAFADYLSPQDAENVRAYVLAQAAAAAAADALPFERADVSINSLKQGWVATGLWLNPGDEVTLAGTGEADLGLGKPLEPRHLVWGRVGEQGDIFQLPSNTHTFAAAGRGELYVTASPPALVWANRQGERVAAWEQMPDAPLAIKVTGFRWRDSARDGLQSMAKDAANRDIAQGALAALDATRALPTGFEYLWFLGSSNVFEAFDVEQRRGVHASTDDDFGIIRRPLDIPLTANTRIDFDWLYEKLPALGPETDAATHDYISIALEFDNGQDITWFWSAHLPEGEMFPCPLPDWQQRETHIVLQSGKQGLGEWHSHSRSVQADYQASVGGEMPTRIVGVWVIANTLFGRQPAEAFFANARITDGEKSVPLFE
jgi:PQQ-dependent dehydrogenase (methanol/ethanol family)